MVSFWQQHENNKILCLPSPPKNKFPKYILTPFFSFFYHNLMTVRSHPPPNIVNSPTFFEFYFGWLPMIGGFTSSNTQQNDYTKFKISIKNWNNVYSFPKFEIHNIPFKGPTIKFVLLTSFFHWQYGITYS